MQPYQLGEVETRFCEIIWAHAPLPSGELVRLAQDALAWKKSTTYTVLRKLCDKGILQNQAGTVTACISQAEYTAIQSEQFVEEQFAGSLPSFLAAFSSRKGLSPAEIAEIQQLIDQYKEG